MLICNVDAVTTNWQLSNSSRQCQKYYVQQSRIVASETADAARDLPACSLASFGPRIHQTTFTKYLETSFKLQLYRHISRLVQIDVYRWRLLCAGTGHTVLQLYNTCFTIRRRDVLSVTDDVD